MPKTWIYVMIRGLLTVIGLIIFPSFLAAAEFPVNKISELKDALVAAGGNETDDKIKIATVKYVATESLSYDSRKDNSMTLQADGGTCRMPNSAIYLSSDRIVQ